MGTLTEERLDRLDTLLDGPDDEAALEQLAVDWHEGALSDPRYQPATRELAWLIALGTPVTIPGTAAAFDRALAAARYAGVPVTITTGENTPRRSRTAIVQRSRS